MMPLTEGGMAPRNIACTSKTMGVSGSNQSAPQEGQQVVTQHLISEPVAEPGVRQQQGIGAPWAAAAAGEQWSGCR